MNYEDIKLKYKDVINVSVEAGFDNDLCVHVSIKCPICDWKLKVKHENYDLFRSSKAYTLIGKLLKLHMEFHEEQIRDLYS